MTTIETGQGSFSLKVRPAKAHFRSGTAVGRSRDAFGDHETESIEIHTVLLGFLKVAQNGLGWGWAGLGWAGLGWGLQAVA